MDLAKLAAQAEVNPFFKEIITTPKIIVSDVKGKIFHSLFNLNELLGRVEGLRWGKTGWTEDAGGCLVSYVKRDGREIIIVVLGSKDRFGETKNLIDWVFESFEWKDLTPSI